MTKMSKSQDFKTRIENFSACIQHKINTFIDNFQGDQKCHKIKIALSCIQTSSCNDEKWSKRD